MSDVKETEEVQWTDMAFDERRFDDDDRRSGIDRRQVRGQAMTIPDMRMGTERRSGTDRRKMVRLTITGRAIDI
ncbi:hypothetical protein [Pleionea sp. CnH1-48]|uniref:hypothetical protein n=1 Tax=Pleionea sp. CnH1-48 TaxID=2954494 RepID=UPI0020971649|nr:hypothetical protein [Pleionea sp. CnH1-48]MCO7223628.1 hypothetical protein [Pleionea sp. CnH1-48]